MLREGYRATARLLRDSDETVTVRWYRCAPGAPALGVEHFMRSLHWESHPYLFDGMGEVWRTVTAIYPYRPFPGADGAKRCGTDQDFAVGGHYDPSAPPAVRTPEGLLLCCHAPPGGIVVGGDLGIPDGIEVGGDPPTDIGGVIVMGGSIGPLATVMESQIDAPIYPSTLAFNGGSGDWYTGGFQPDPPYYTWACLGPSMTGVPGRWQWVYYPSAFVPFTATYQTDIWDGREPRVFDKVDGDAIYPPTALITPHFE